MNVLVIPEDYRKDQYLLKPLFNKLFTDLGRPRARIQVCTNPLLGGVSEALKIERIRHIVEMYPMVNLFLLCVDRDGEIGRRVRLDQIEKEFSDKIAFVAENTWEELETWTLAGLDLPKEWNWHSIRQAVDVKERYFEPLARHLKVQDGPGGGRRALGELAAKRLDAILLKCADDFGALSARIEAML